MMKDLEHEAIIFLMHERLFDGIEGAAILINKRFSEPFLAGQREN